MTKRFALTFGACLAIASFGANAHTVNVEGSVEAEGGSYVGAGGNVLKTGMGGCLRTGTFSDDSAINACEGIADEEATETAEVTPEAPKPAKAKIDTRDFSELALFDTDSADLNSAGMDAMNALVSAVSEYKGVTAISVTGHTDSNGAEDYNQDLSERRAATVAAMLADQYPDTRIDVSGMGESSPVATNDTAEGRQQNRRVEVELTANRMTFE